MKLIIERKGRLETMKIYALYMVVYPITFAAIFFAIYSSFISLSLNEWFIRILPCVVVGVFAIRIGEKLYEDILTGKH